LPEEEYEAIKNLKYSTLKDYWEDKIKTISIIDYDAVSSSKK
jgi:intein/homing endonuclease